MLLAVRAKASTRRRASPSASGAGSVSASRVSPSSSRFTRRSMAARYCGGPAERRLSSVDADPGEEGLLLLLELVEVDGAVLVLLVDGLHEADEVAGRQVALAGDDGRGAGVLGGGGL